MRRGCLLLRIRHVRDEVRDARSLQHHDRSLWCPSHSIQLLHAMLGVFLWSLVAHQWKLQRLCSTRTLRCRHHVHDNDGMYGCPGQGGDQLPWCTEGVSVCVWCLCCVCVCVVLFVIFVFVIKCAALCYKEKTSISNEIISRVHLIWRNVISFLCTGMHFTSFLSSLNAPYFFLYPICVRRLDSKRFSQKIRIFQRFNHSGSLTHH